MRNEEPSGLVFESLRSLTGCRDEKSAADAVLRGAVALAGADAGYFFPVKDNGGLDDPVMESAGENPRAYGASRAAKRALVTGKEAREKADGGGEFLAFPLAAGTNIAGVCCLECAEGQADAATLRLFFSHAAVVMENLALHRRLGERGADAGIVITPVKERHVRAARERLDGTGGPVTRADLAEHAGISPDYLGKLFRLCTGKPLREYRNEARVKRALDLLAENGLSLVEAGSEAGFSSRRSFYRVFKKMVGMTPAEYRRMAGGDMRNEGGS